MFCNRAANPAAAFFCRPVNVYIYESKKCGFAFDAVIEGVPVEALPEGLRFLYILNLMEASDASKKNMGNNRETI